MKANILLVDDSPENLLAFEQVLRSLDVNIITAISGNEALTLVLEHDFALVLLDVQMPAMDGFETAKLMRGIDKTRHLPIIFVTAISKDQKHVFTGYATGAVDYLFKPVAPDILRSKVTVFLELHRQKTDLERTNAELKKVKQETEALNRQLEQTVEHAGQMAVEARHANKIKSEFLATMSHELRTPLTSIQGALGLLLGGVAGQLLEKAAALIEIAHRNSDRLVRLINDILDIEKIEAGKMVFDLRRHDLTLLIQQAIETNKAYAGTFGVTLVFQAPDDGGEVLVDADRFAQVLANLLSNAAKFSPEHGAVEVSCTRIEDRIRIVVADHGPGIAEEFRPRLFEKFSQADSSDTCQKGGTGLGLSICKAIVEKMGGEIGYETRIGGAAFYFELPV